MFQRHTLKRVLNYLNQQEHCRNYNFHNKHNLNSAYFQINRFNQSVADGRCWKCGITRKSNLDLFCEGCQSIQNPSERNNYFKVFNIDVTYDVNQKNLTESYRKMQSVLHPDKFSNKYDKFLLFSKYIYVSSLVEVILKNKFLPSIHL